MIGLSTAAIRVLRLLSCFSAGSLALAGALWSLVLGYADMEFRSGSASGVATALRIAPMDAGYLAQWSLLTPNREDASHSLERAVYYDSYYAWAWIQLGAAAESEGRYDLAERDLLRAARVDRGFSPRWALCDFYFRRHNAERFWYWSSQALATNNDEAGPVFRLQWRMDPSAEDILARGIPEDKAVRRKFLTFLMQEQQPVKISSVISSLLPAMEREDLPLLLSYTTRLLDERDTNPALVIWNNLCGRGWLPFHPLNPDAANILTNSNFSTPPSGNVFDWQLNAGDGISSHKEASSGDFIVQLSGRQPENCRILGQRIVVKPGKRYKLDFHVNVTGDTTKSGLRWKVLGGAGANTPLAESPDLGTDDPGGGILTFSSGSEALVTVALDYDRPRGQTRSSVSIRIGELSVRALSRSEDQ